MQFLNTLLALAAITSAFRIPANAVSSDLMLQFDYQYSVTCGQKNPAVNTLIDGFCNRKDIRGQLANNLTIGHPWARNGLRYGDYKVHITGPTCPADSKYIPAKYCNAQLHYLCAVSGGDKGMGAMNFGLNGCQSWQLQNLKMKCNAGGCSAW